ncbi:ribbon-helix-helix domain-containing protein [Anaerotruncus rubiinfantis]|uniref:ribbon-helix-helix domain-containing protein n=1 Tax=Anaerotruncus rubiinfantis TaxID=1720200 RepID=UPI0034A42070
MNRTEYKNKWQSENRDRVNLTLPKGFKEEVETYAKAHGESMTAFIIRAIREAMERDNQDK